MSKHTPGPWRLEMVEDRAIKHLCPVGTDDLSILTVVHQDDTPFAAVYSDADARLITAAPDLLEMVRITIGNVRSLGPAGALDKVWPAYREWLAQLEAAYAKATGQSDPQDPGAQR